MLAVLAINGRGFSSPSNSLATNHSPSRSNRYYMFNSRLTFIHAFYFTAHEAGAKSRPVSVKLDQVV